MEINKKKLAVGLLFLVLVGSYAALAIYSTYYQPQQEVAPVSADAPAGAAAEKKQALLDLADQLMEKRNKLGPATYEFTITEGDSAASGMRLVKMVWDDYNNYGEIASGGNFLGVDKGLLYDQRQGKAEFRASLAQGDPLAATDLRDFVFDNLLWDVKNNPESSAYDGEEFCDGKTCCVFENKRLVSGSKTEVVRKFWISKEDGILVREEVESRSIVDGVESSSEVQYVAQSKSPVFSQDKQLIDPVALSPDNLPDTDQDGLLDAVEKSIFKTDPQNPDTDGDGHLDGEEVDAGYDPTVPSPHDKLLD